MSVVRGHSSQYIFSASIPHPSTTIVANPPRLVERSAESNRQLLRAPSTTPILQSMPVC